MTALFALILVTQAGAPAALPPPECSLVPGWSPQGDARRYVPETLFEYKNGGAEAYFTYGFTLLKGITCVDGAGNELVIDVSALGDPDHAWGFFIANHDPRSPVEAIGSAAQVLPMSATLAKGPYYVEIAASPDKDHGVALRAFLDALLACLPGEAHVPEAVSYFPPEGLETGSLRLVPQSVLGLRFLRTGFVGRYSVGRAFVVTERTPEAAGETLLKLHEHFATARPVTALGVEALTAEDRYLDGVLFFRKGRRVAGVVNIPAGQDALPLAKALVEWLPE